MRHLPFAILLLSQLAFAGEPQAPNAQMQAVLDKHAQLGAKPIEMLTPTEARQQPTLTDAVTAIMAERGITPPLPQMKFEDRTVQGAVGLLTARYYFPAIDGPLPVIVYFHGGGFVLANREVYDASARSLASGTDAIVVSVDYRLAPEAKFPAAHDDAYAAYQWVVANAATFGGDPARVAVAGESAGGNLAIHVSRMARDAGFQLPTHQLLIYPIADSDANSESYQLYGMAKPLNKAMMGWFGAHYLNAPVEATDLRISVANADLHGLPKTTIVAAEIDPLRSEGQKLSTNLQAAGVNVMYRKWDGVTHEFFGMATLVDAAREAQQFAAEMLRGGI